MSNDTEYERAERIFGNDLKAAEMLAKVLNPEVIFAAPKPSNVIPLRRTPNYAGDATIADCWEELQRQAAAETLARIEAMTPEERDAHERNERSRQAMLDAGWEP